MEVNPIIQLGQQVGHHNVHKLIPLVNLHQTFFHRRQSGDQQLGIFQQNQRLLQLNFA